MADTTEATNIQRVEIDNLDALLGTPGADNILTSTEPVVPNIFSKPSKVDMSFTSPKETEEEKALKAQAVKDAAAKAAKEAQTNPTTANAANQIVPGAPVPTAEEIDQFKAIVDEFKSDPNDPTDKNKGAGRPKMDKDSMVELTKKFIEKGIMVPFEDGKPIEEYSTKDFEELYEANHQDREARIRESVPVEFFQSLPPELQVAAKYHADGGKDMKTLFRVLAQVEETRSLNPENPQDQEHIVREYLRATRFGDDVEIQEEIDGWKDMEKLAEKANKFKPKLDAMNEQVVAQKLAEQESNKKNQENASRAYMSNVYETLKPAELGGIKLDKKTQSMLYNGLVAPNYPSMSGRPTNLLGHLLEKYQFVEPNHGLIAEALWLLANPDEYKAKLREGGKQEQVAATIRTLKTEEASRKGTGQQPIEETTSTKQRTIQRTSNFFSR